MKIYYQDKKLIVCGKEPGILSEHTPAGDGLPDRIAGELGIAPEQVYVVHRLDRTTGGLMVYALDAKTAAHLSEEIREGRFEKEYLALAEGEMESGEMIDQLYFDRTRNQSFVVKKRPGAKEARLSYAVKGVFPSPWPETEKVSLCLVRLETGRTHQIRVQFAGIGCPVTGDDLYGTASPHIGRHALHSYITCFPHPADGREMVLTAPLHEDMLVLLDAVTGDSAPVLAAAETYSRCAIPQKRKDIPYGDEDL